MERKASGNVEKIFEAYIVLQCLLNFLRLFIIYKFNDIQKKWEVLMKTNILKKENLLYYLGSEVNFGSSRFRKCLQKAYMSESIDKYLVGNNVVFKQGSGRTVYIPRDIVEDIIGISIDLPRCVA